MILKAKHHPIIYPFFQVYSKWLLKRNFSLVKIIGNFTEKDFPILLISNHTSWWDGFWTIYLNMKVFKRRFHFMMLEEQLRKYWYFNYTGGFSIKKKSKSVVESILYTKALLKSKHNLVLLFPQGEIESMHQQSFTFKKGIERILENENHSVQIIFLACLTDYFSSKKPGLYLHFEEFLGRAVDLKNLEEEYTRFYKNCVEQQLGFKQ